jgi:hypothetical protein
VYAVLSLVSSIGAYTSGEYLRARLSEEASRAKIAKATENEKAQDLLELVDSIHQQVNEFRRAQVCNRWDSSRSSARKQDSTVWK